MHFLSSRIWESNTKSFITQQHINASHHFRPFVIVFFFKKFTLIHHSFFCHARFTHCQVSSSLIHIFLLITSNASLSLVLEKLVSFPFWFFKNVFLLLRDSLLFFLTYLIVFFFSLINATCFQSLRIKLMFQELIKIKIKEEKQSYKEHLSIRHFADRCPNSIESVALRFVSRNIFFCNVTWSWADSLQIRKKFKKIMRMKTYKMRRKNVGAFSRSKKSKEFSPHNS